VYALSERVDTCPWAVRVLPDLGTDCLAPATRRPVAATARADALPEVSGAVSGGGLKDTGFPNAGKDQSVASEAASDPQNAFRKTHDDPSDACCTLRATLEVRWSTVTRVASRATGRTSPRSTRFPSPCLSPRRDHERSRIVDAMLDHDHGVSEPRDPVRGPLTAATVAPQRASDVLTALPATGLACADPLDSTEDAATARSEAVHASRAAVADVVSRPSGPRDAHAACPHALSP